MLYEFLLSNREKILFMTEKKSLVLAGVRASSDQLKKGLPIFFNQLVDVLKREAASPQGSPTEDLTKMKNAATDGDEPAMAKASGRPHEAELAQVAGIHGKELLRLGYTLSHVVHAYGAICQSITELATTNKTVITANEFHDLNRCLDVAIAGAVTEFQALRNSEESNREIQHLGVLAHEMRNALATVTMSLELIKDGTVGFKGSIGQVLDRGLKRMGELIDRSLAEVRLRVEPKISIESVNILLLVDQIVVTAEAEALRRKQTLEIKIDSHLEVEADQELLYSALSNIIQNALKYTREGGKIQVRAETNKNDVIIEVEDECGGLSNSAIDLFKPYEQQNENRDGLGLGLTIVQRAVKLNNGTVDVVNLPRKGCIFKIQIPQKFEPATIQS